MDNSTAQGSNLGVSLVIGVVAFFLGVMVTYGMFQAGFVNTYNSSAKEKICPSPGVFPSVTRKPTASPAVTKGPINNREGLINALDELENANDNAVEEIQSLIQK